MIATDVTDAATKASEEDITEVTGPPATEPAAVPAEVTEVTVTEANTPSVTITEAIEADAADVTETPQPLTTNVVPVETAAPTTQAEALPEVTAAAETETEGDVLVEGESTGEQHMGWMLE